MDWRAAILFALASNLFRDASRPINQFESSYLTVSWHYNYKIIGDTSPKTKAAYYNNSLKIFYLGKETESANLQIFDSPKNSFLGDMNSIIEGLIYDQNSGQVHRNLSANPLNPALIALSATNAYVREGTQWVRSCSQCVNSNISNSSAEIFLSHDKTFWASLDDGGRVITSKDFREWTPRGNPQPDTIRSLFPILDSKSQPKWVLVYLNNVAADYSYYSYNVGTLSYETGFAQQLGPFNLTCGQGKLDTYFATKGDDVNNFQYFIPTTLNTMEGQSGPPVILNTLRQVMFKEISGQEILVQQPVLTATNIPVAYPYQFANTKIINGIQGSVLGGIRSLSFIMSVEFKLDDSKEVGVLIRRSRDDQQRTGIGYLAEGVFYVGMDQGPWDRSNNDNATMLNKYNKTFEAKLTPTVASGNPTFLIYLDGPLLEVFCDNNQVNFNTLVLAKKDSDRMALYSSRNSSATLVSLNLSAYDKY